MHTVAVRETVVSDILSIFSSLHTGLYNRFRLRFEFQVKTYELQYKTDIFENRLFKNQSDQIKCFSKAELPQVCTFFRTQFPSLGILSIKKLEIEKTKTT